MVHVVVNNGQYKITIPKDIALSKQWNSQTKLRFVEDLEGNIFLKELSPPPLEKSKRGVR